MNQTVRMSFLCFAGLSVLAACGGGSGGEGSGVSSSVDASVATVDLQRNAARNASANVGAGLGGLGRVFSDSLPFADGFVEPQDVDGVEPGGASEFESTDTGLVTIAPMIDDTESRMNTLLEASLGLEGALARTQRSGSRVTIDPDDASVCEALDPDLYDVDATSTVSVEQRLRCEELAGRLTVLIDAQSEQTGVITVQFDRQSLLLVGYGPSQASFDLDLATARELAAAAESLDGDTGGVPAVMQGRLRFEATASNQTPGRQAGTFRISVPSPIRIQDTAMGIDLSQSATSGFVLSADEATGNASVEIDSGAVRMLLDSGDPGSAFAYNNPGFTARLDLVNEGSRLVVSRLGLAKGPLTLSIDNTQALSLALAPFGFTVDESDGLVVFDTDLDLSINLAAEAGLAPSAFSVDATLRGPRGTRLLGGGEGGDLVRSGGPLSFVYETLADGQLSSGFTTWRVGSCDQSPANGDSVFSIGCQ